VNESSDAVGGFNWVVLSGRRVWLYILLTASIAGARIRSVFVRVLVSLV